jgi:hypothetical protein
MSLRAWPKHWKGYNWSLLADPLALGALIVGSSVPAASVVVETRSPAPMVPLSRFRSNIFCPGAQLLS